jgi:hypothetical protein
MSIQALMRDEVISSLNFLTRWNFGTPGMVTSKDTISNHSFWVSFFSNLVLENHLFSEPEEAATFWRIKSLAKDFFLYHDFDEAFTGDVLHGLKYNSHNGSIIRKSLDEYIDKSLQNYLESKSKVGLSKTFTDTLRRNLTDLKTFDYWLYIKSVCKLGDCLSSIFILTKEMELSNNSSRMLDVYLKYLIYLEESSNTFLMHSKDLFRSEAVNVIFNKTASLIDEEIRVFVKKEKHLRNG